MGRRRAGWRPWMLGLLVLSLGAKDADNGVMQDIPGHGKINWTDRTVTARGSGAPSKKAKNPAAARLGAERAAKLDAYRNILEALKGVQVTAQKSASDVMASDEIKAQVEGMIRGARVVDTVYYSDLSVDVVLRMPLDGALANALIPKVDKKTDVPQKGTATNTGLVINAKGLKLVPALNPRVLDEKGNEVYDLSRVSESAVRENGMVNYVNDLSQATEHERVKGKPLLVKALAAGKDGKSDIVISNADADKLRDSNTNLAFLSEGRVVVVVD